MVHGGARNILLWFRPRYSQTGSRTCVVTLFFLSGTYFGPNYFIKHFSGSWHNKTSRDDHSDWDPVPHCLSYFLFVSLDRLSPGGESGILGSEQSQDPWPVIQGSPDLTQASFNLCDLLSTSATNSFPHFEFYRLCCSLFVSFGQFKLTCCCGGIVAFKWYDSLR